MWGGASNQTAGIAQMDLHADLDDRSEYHRHALARAHFSIGDPISLSPAIRPTAQYET